ncbi:MAG: hypothetical protein K8H74_13750 [Notoacmeibacter sp.]|nr:hypothetical protein [Notoacmeibacter sp.]
MTGQAHEGKAEHGFFATRWRGETAIDRLVLFDMLLAATGINIVAAFAAVMMLGFKLPEWIAIVTYVAPMPYNIFLVLAVWRTTGNIPPRAARNYRLAALVWLAAAVLI